MKFFLPLTAFLTFLAFAANAQHTHSEWCGEHTYRDVLDAEYPGYTLMAEEARMDMLRKLAEDPSLGEHRGGVRTIPVVFHVVWNTPAENISDAVLQAQLDRLNADFATSFQNTQVSQFLGVAANTEIQFCLASTNPQGNPTTGITRTQTNVTTFPIGNDMKSNTTGGINPWPTQSYYNVWICDIGFDPMTGGTAGYAYLPSAGPQFEAIDGTVLAYQVVGNETTLTHETGHYLGLHHTWGVDFESCQDDDGFTDTPNCETPSYGSWQNNGCPLTKQTCGSLDMVENFMDYASCPTIFTQQQSAYMNNLLSTPYNGQWPFQIGRAGLISSNGCDGQQGGGDAPVADFVGSPTTVPVGVNVNFTDQSTNTPTSWSWTFGDGGTSNVQNPSHSYTAPGQYTVSLTATNANGSDTETKQNYITVTDNGNGGGTTTCDSLCYLDGQFIAQVNPTDASAFEAYLIDNDQEPVAAPLAQQGYTSDWIQFYEIISPGDTNFFWGATSWHEDDTAPADNWITFGPVTIPSDGADLEWRHAFIDNDFRDGYRVLVNFAGTDVADFNGATVLFSVNDNDPSTAADTDWAWQSVNLAASTYAGQQVYIGFHHNALDMYVLFLDDIYMHGCSTAPVGLEEASETLFHVFPNPSTQDFTVQLDLPSSQRTDLMMVNILGQPVWQQQVQNAGPMTFEISTAGLPAGIYTLMLRNDEVNTSKRLILTR